MDKLTDLLSQAEDLSAGKKKLHDAVQKKYRVNLIFRMSDEKFTIRDVPRVSSGELGLDIALGGGFPRGRFIKIAGPRYSVGKSKLVATYLSILTRMHHEDVMVIDIEGTWTAQWLLGQGVDITRVYYSRPETAEQGLDIAEAALESNEYSSVVVDSIAAMTPSAELEGSHSDQQYAALARLVSKFCRKMEGRMNRAHNRGLDVPTIFMVNQMRTNIGDSFNPWVTPGGGQQDNAASVIVNLTRRNMLWDGPKDQPEADRDYVGWMTQAFIDKNKTAPPMKRTLYGVLNQPFLGHFKYSYFHADTLFRFGLKVGIIEQSGTWYSIPSADVKEQGHNNFCRMLAERMDLRECITEDIKSYLSMIPIQFQANVPEPIEVDDDSVTELSSI